MQKAKQFTGIVAGIAAVLALKFYGKARTQEDMKAELVKSCKGDQACAKVVDAHFATCFDQNYAPGAQRSNDSFLRCFNEKAGTVVFVQAPVKTTAH